MPETSSTEFPELVQRLTEYLTGHALPVTKALAFLLYLEGVDQKTIGRILGEARNRDALAVATVSQMIEDCLLALLDHLRGVIHVTDQAERIFRLSTRKRRTHERTLDEIAAELALPRSDVEQHFRQLIAAFRLLLEHC